MGSAPFSDPSGMASSMKRVRGGTALTVIRSQSATDFESGDSVTHTMGDESDEDGREDEDGTEEEHCGKGWLEGLEGRAKGGLQERRIIRIA